MTRPRRTRHDLNQRQLVRDLRRLGAVVWDTADLGGQVLDLIVHWRGQTRVVEVKRAANSILTANEADSILALRLVGVTAIVATTCEDVVEGWEVSDA